ncbi:GntR family transcriptional regulator [Bacillus sp. Marseille-P3800]|uniref:GntR family transcriptional regulator n=1 Tax=Bacillus sp. Marseille-P3800 TaxID=2014782 RepID=UPI000C08316F|nr:GntR family transcriptional regulator [Bacillus sp. Marseille-P3800]
MSAKLNKSLPLFLQVRDVIIKDIISGILKEGEKVYSENDLTAFYEINRATVRQGLQLLVDEDIIYKKRGVGMFVQDEARKVLISQRENHFHSDFLKPLIEEAKMLGITYKELLDRLEKEKYEC